MLRKSDCKGEFIQSWPVARTSRGIMRSIACVFICIGLLSARANGAAVTKPDMMSFVDLETYREWMRLSVYQWSYLISAYEDYSEIKVAIEKKKAEYESASAGGLGVTMDAQIAYLKEWHSFMDGLVKIITREDRILFARLYEILSEDQYAGYERVLAHRKRRLFRVYRFLNYTGTSCGDLTDIYSDIDISECLSEEAVNTIGIITVEYERRLTSMLAELDKKSSRLYTKALKTMRSNGISDPQDPEFKGIFTTLAAPSLRLAQKIDDYNLRYIRKWARLDDSYCGYLFAQRALSCMYPDLEGVTVAWGRSQKIVIDMLASMPPGDMGGLLEMLFERYNRNVHELISNAVRENVIVLGRSSPYITVPNLVVTDAIEDDFRKVLVAFRDEMGSMFGPDMRDEFRGRYNKMKADEVALYAIADALPSRDVPSSDDIRSQIRRIMMDMSRIRNVIDAQEMTDVENRSIDNLIDEWKKGIGALASKEKASVGQLIEGIELYENRRFAHIENMLMAYPGIINRLEIIKQIRERAMYFVIRSLYDCGGAAKLDIIQLVYDEHLITEDNAKAIHDIAKEYNREVRGIHDEYISILRNVEFIVSTRTILITDNLVQPLEKKMATANRRALEQMNRLNASEVNRSMRRKYYALAYPHLFQARVRRLAAITDEYASRSLDDDHKFLVKEMVDEYTAKSERITMEICKKLDEQPVTRWYRESDLLRPSCDWKTTEAYQNYLGVSMNIYEMAREKIRLLFE